MSTRVYLRPSSRSDKKFVVTILNGNRRCTVHFGAKGYSDYTQHKDEDRMYRYLMRHRKKEKWGKAGMCTAGFWSRWLLWSKPSLTGAISLVQKKFGIKIVRKEPPRL